MDKCSHTCSKSHKPCESNTKLHLDGVGYCLRHYNQHKLKEAIEAAGDQVPDIFALAQEKDQNEP